MVNHAITVRKSRKISESLAKNLVFLTIFSLNFHVMETFLAI